ncbi:MAG: uroporphyrinogen decarboxylase family protein [Candidatus Bathyarchaeia archaeon]
MDSRKRVLAAINLSKPDRVPLMHSPLPGALMKYGERLIEIFRKYPHDFGPTEFTVPKPEELPADYKAGVHRDSWGTVWASTVDGIHGQVVDHPIKTIEDYSRYELPRPQRDLEEYRVRLKRHADDLRAKGFFVILGFDPGNFFERLQWLRGFRNLMVDLIKGRKELEIFADRLLEYCLSSLQTVLEARPDAVSFSDDWGTQDRLMINPSLWRSFFKPRYRAMFKLVHDHNAYVYFHSDGYIMDIIPDLIEIGVDVLNPQFSCHNLELLADSVRGKVCISSDIDRQHVLPRGSPKDVEAYVKMVIELFGYGNSGGLIGRGEVNIDVPLENVEAMYRAFMKYGRYSWQSSP